MAFKASRKFHLMGPRTAKDFDEAYSIYVREIDDSKEAENLAFLYRSALYKIFLENKYAGANGSMDMERSGTMSFEKAGGVRVEISKIEVFPINKTGPEDERHVFDFYVSIDGNYEMGFPDGKLLEGYKMLNTLGDEVRDIFTNKLLKKPQRPLE